MKTKEIDYKTGGGNKEEAFIAKGNGPDSGQYCEEPKSRKWLISETTKKYIANSNNNVIEAWDKAKRYFKYFSLNSSEHFLKRIDDRKIPLEVLIDTLVNTYKITDVETDINGRKSFRIIGYNVIICVNPTNRKIITVFPTRKNIQDKIAKGE